LKTLSTLLKIFIILELNSLIQVPESSELNSTLLKVELLLIIYS